MPGTKSLNPLAARKQLLIAESEINRAHLLRDGRIIRDGIHVVTHKARSLSWLASMAGLLASGFVAIRGKKSRLVETKQSWVRKAANGVKTILPIWLALRRRKRKEQDSNPEAAR